MTVVPRPFSIGQNRRNFLAGAVAVPFCVWAEEVFGKPPSPLRTRYNVRSAKGSAMLKVYAAGVKKMMAAPSTDPTSWVFQWYTHWVPGTMSPGPKQQQINQIFGSGSSPQKTLAQTMWDTCQSHGPGEPEDNFLPWHRMYVYFLEQIIRKVTNVQNFTLPYWNYSVSGPAHGVVPQKFRMQNNPVWGPLFRTNRNAGPNSGQPIDQNNPGALALTALNETSYSPQGVSSGFCQTLDFGLHGSVHVLVGNTQGMGQVPYAAGDPIFWMHHCNIDRLWASWNKCGGKNPTDPGFLNRTFTFADINGNAVTAKISDFLSTQQLHYTYDHFEVPTIGCTPSAFAEVISAQTVSSLGSASGVALGSSAVKVNLENAAAGAGGEAIHAEAATAGRKMHVLLKKLKTDVAPGVLYHVYLDLPEGADPKNAPEHYVGTINFFDSVQHEGHSEDDSGKFYSFGVTDLVKTLQSKKRLAKKPALTIVPFDKPEADAKPLVGEISLVAQ